ncbi:MAG: amino acid ABC transporter substrate-binding protein [Acidimicrobiia bacterium]|nr:amino acid ABC transporter substrate-binding protein [Acidimicrobiia bacterium]
MIKRLAVLIAVLAMVAAACGGTTDETTPDTTVAADTTAAPDGGGGQAGGTLAEVIARGELRCGVSTTAIGFAEPQDDGSYDGFDADYCRATAAAIFGDQTKVVFVGLTAAERFTALANGEVDVLFRNTTWTQDRDTTIGGDFGPTTFYDGQQVMGVAGGNISDNSTLADVDGARLCTNAGTTTEKNITEGAKVVGAEITLVTVEDFDQAMAQFRAGACDLVTTDGSGLFGERFDAISKGEIIEGEWAIFPSAPISKEPLGPMYRQNDSEWADVINWIVYATFIADEKGITKDNVAAAVASPPDPEAGRLLGVTDDEIQSNMGLSADAFANVIAQVGNYNDIYVSNLADLGFVRAGTPNDQWFRGGLIYAPPAR